MASFTERADVVVPDGPRRQRCQLRPRQQRVGQRMWSIVKRRPRALTACWLRQVVPERDAAGDRCKRASAPEELGFLQRQRQIAVASGDVFDAGPGRRRRPRTAHVGEEHRGSALVLRAEPGYAQLPRVKSGQPARPRARRHPRWRWRSRWLLSLVGSAWGCSLGVLGASGGGSAHHEPRERGVRARLVGRPGCRAAAAHEGKQLGARATTSRPQQQQRLGHHNVRRLHHHCCCCCCSRAAAARNSAMQAS